MKKKKETIGGTRQWSGAKPKYTDIQMKADKILKAVAAAAAALLLLHNIFKL